MSFFDWDRAIDLNRTALLGVVSVLLRLLSFGDIQGVVFLSLGGRRRVLRVLVPAEAALRRLIYVFVRAKKVRVSPAPPPGKRARPLPDFSAFKNVPEDVGRVPFFKLSDTHKPIDWSAFYEPEDAPVRAAQKPAASDASEPVACTDLLRRTRAMEAALSNLPKAARRMAREEARRLAVPLGTIFISVLRHGPPPGRRQRGREEVDAILRECHGLSWDVERWPP